MTFLSLSAQRGSRCVAHPRREPLYLDNFDHITAYWVGLGLKLAQVALSYGADDLHGTIIEEHIFHMAGATSPQLRQREHATTSVLQTEADMIKAIREGPCEDMEKIRLPSCIG